MENLIQAMAQSTLNVPTDKTILQGRKIVDENLSAVIPEKEVRDFLITNLIKSPETGQFSWRCNLDVIKKNFKTGIAHFPEVLDKQPFNGEVLFIGGGASDFIGKNDLPGIKKIFPKAQLVFIPNTGHWVHSQKPTEFLRICVEFLDK